MPAADDPLAPLLDLPDVAPALQAARIAVDEAFAHRALRRRGGAVAAEVNLRSAVASAALEGCPHPRDDVRAGLVTDPVLQGALRVAEALPGLVDRWSLAPRQVLARLHLLAARGLVGVGEQSAADPVQSTADRQLRDALTYAHVGRPRPGTAARLDMLAAVATGGSRVPPLLLAAVVHGELLALRAFAGPYGLVARAAGRLVLAWHGVDPRLLIATEVGHLARQPEYVGAAGAFATGTRDGVRSWLLHCAKAVELGAQELIAIGDKLFG